jgi:hypothetical protein
MEMPHNNKDHLSVRRLNAITAISLAIFFAVTSPMYFVKLPAIVIALWSVAAGWGSFYIGIQAARPDWRCALPQPLRALFFRTLEHPWKETQRLGDYVEEYCEKCQQYRHGKMTRYDLVEGGWKEGRIPKREGVPSDPFC